MKAIHLLVLILFCLSTALYANAVGVVDSEDGIYLNLQESEVDVTIENQVSLVTHTSHFYNDLGEPVSIRFAFPLPAGASATGLTWTINNVQYEAIIEPTQQDTLPGGGDTDPALLEFLGDTPLYFNIDQTLLPDSVLEVTLNYVELLPYSAGEVSFYCPNDYQLIQEGIVIRQALSLTLNSDRTITEITCPSHDNAQVTNNVNSATVDITVWESQATSDYLVNYTLDPEELGLFGFSSFIPDSLVPDGYGRGFMAFIAEPDPSDNTQVIQKTFTLVIDRSGSMWGDRIVQARNAASYIVNNLNDGDLFNLIAFSNTVNSWQEDHVAFTEQTRNQAQDWITDITATGSTNISGTLTEAVAQFAGSDTTHANIIIFFTDGEATAGLTNTQDILNAVAEAVEYHDVTVSLFSFGIGDQVNEELLTLLATDNNGLVEFLGADALEERITAFYDKIRNPVILNTELSFAPDRVVEIYPDPLPNLYQGQQMVVVGRYTYPDEVQVNFTGTNYANSVEYNYPFTLTDENVLANQFLPKFWAKLKIEHLMLQYYAVDPDSPEAEIIEDLIIELSLQYGVITEFTSFVGGDITGLDEVGESEPVLATEFRLLGSYPNPFNGSAHIRFEVLVPLNQMVSMNIYNSLGQLVRSLTIWVSGPGEYVITWDGLLANGKAAPSDQYVYVIDSGSTLISGRMSLIK